jgi:AcrR family transcriptional regulator
LTSLSFNFILKLDYKTELVEMNEKINKDELLRGQIVSAARKLFQQYGLVKTTMEDIAKAMGKGKSTLYYYYKSKEEIFEAVVNEEFEEVLSCIREKVTNSSTASGKLAAYIVTMGKMIKTKINLYKIVKGELAENSSMIDSLRCKINDKEIEIVCEILQFGQNMNEFIPIPDVDISIYASAMVSAVRSISIDLIKNNIDNSERQFELMQKVIIKGILR